MQSYRPSFILRNGNLQTVLGQRILPKDRFVTVGEQPILFDAGLDHTHSDPGRAVRLLGYYTPGRREESDAPNPRGLVMLLHGWEGNSHSAYNLVVGSALIRAGFDVVRLNMRDHGPTHHLNRGLFYATLIEEVHAATQQVGLWSGDKPFFVVGASLGANFAIRMALRHGQFPIPNLLRSIAINPVLNPVRTCALLDEHRLLLAYFRNSWLRSLRKKQALFPDLYDFRPLAAIAKVVEMTDWLVKKIGPYRNVDEYLEAYGVSPAQIADLTVPVSILTAANDPLIPSADVEALPPHPLLQRCILPFGGHVAYNDLFPLRSRLPELVMPLLEQDMGEG